MNDLLCRIFAFFTALWYAFTQRMGYRRHTRARVHPAAALSDIPARLNYGRSYKYDRRIGPMAHPRNVQACVNANTGRGDCEDHAGYWIAVLELSGLAGRTAMGFVAFREKDGTKTWHAVALFERNGVLYWADYVDAKVTSWETWAHDVAKDYDCTVRRAYAITTRTDEKDTVLFEDTVMYGDAPSRGFETP